MSKSPFKIAVINDEISQDFGHACEVASQQFGMEWMELRGMWNKNVVNLDANEIAEAQRLLKKKATCASPISPARCSKRIGRVCQNQNSVRSTTSSAPTLLTTSRAKFLIAPSSWLRSSPLTAFAASISGGLKIGPVS